MSGSAVDAMRAERDAYRAALADAGFDGPHYLGGGLFAREAAVCIGVPDQWPGCGAVVLLDHEHPLPDGRQGERGIRLHATFHLNHPEPSPPGPDQA